MSLGIIKEARYWQSLLDDGCTIAELCDVTNHNASYIRNRLSLLNLLPLAQKHIDAGFMPLRTGYLMATFDKEKQIKLFWAAITMNVMEFSKRYKGPNK